MEKTRKYHILQTSWMLHASVPSTRLPVMMRNRVLRMHFQTHTSCCGHPPRADLDIQPLKRHQQREPPCRTAWVGGATWTLKTLSTPHHSPLHSSGTPQTPQQSGHPHNLHPLGPTCPAQSRGSTEVERAGERESDGGLNGTD